MSAISPKNAGISPASSAKGRSMTSIAEAQSLITTIAGPMPAGTQIKEMLSGVARVTGLAHRRLRGIWNGEARRIDAQEMDVLRQAAARRRREAIDHEEFRTLSTRLALLEKRLAQIDPEFDGATADAGCPSAVAISGSDCAMARGCRA